MLEKQLAQSQKLESIGTLAAGIAHEINTPIQFIGNNTNFVLDSIPKLFDCINAYKDVLNTCGPGEKTNIPINKADELKENFELSYLIKLFKKPLLFTMLDFNVLRTNIQGFGKDG